MRELALLSMTLIVLGTAIYFSTHGRPRSRLAARGAGSRWHGVAINPSRGACVSARSLWNIRYLSKDAPPLPLTGCDAAVCRCHFRHYSDRRTQERRDIGGGMPMLGRIDRRQGRRRRLSRLNRQGI